MSASLPKFMRKTFLLFAVLASVAARPGELAPPKPQPRNLILMIADGFGPASRTMARGVKDFPLALDDILVGSCSTHAANSLVTDSAASATAYACGVKTNNGAVGVDSGGKPAANLREAFEAAGKASGIVTTTQVTHATPAAFSAHVATRMLTQQIAQQQLSAGLEVLFGGGSPDFRPAGAGGRRADGRDLLEEAREAGVSVVTSRAAFDEDLALPAIALFGDSHMAYEIDRDPALEPSIAEMTEKALALLSEHEAGFLLVVEGGRVDHAAHANDPATHARDVLAYDAAVAVALAFAREDGKTLVVSTSDHETGGMSLGRAVNGRAVYGWKPGLLAGASASLDRLAADLATREDWEAPVLAKTGLAELTEDEREELAAARTAGSLGKALKELVSERAGIGWTTNGHTAVDVELFAFGPGADRLRGSLDNAEMGRRLAALFGFDLALLTGELHAGATSGK